MITNKKSLKFNSAVPLYYQLKELLKDEITLKTWLPDQMIPSEAELSASYDVSVGTVKKALSELVQECVLYRKQGKGTFVARPNFENSLIWRFKNSTDKQGNPLIFHSDVLSSEVINPDEEVQKALELSANEKVISIKTLRQVRTT